MLGFFVCIIFLFFRFLFCKADHQPPAPVHIFPIHLEGIAVGAAADGAGQAGALPGLEHDDSDQEQTAEHLNDHESEFHFVNSSFPISHGISPESYTVTEV